MIQTTMDLLVSPKMQEAQKNVPATGEPKDFAKLLDDIATGTEGLSAPVMLVEPIEPVELLSFPRTVFDLIGEITEEETEESEEREENSEQIFVSSEINPLVFAALPIEQQVVVEEKITAEQNTEQKIIPEQKFIPEQKIEHSETEPQILQEAEIISEAAALPNAQITENAQNIQNAQPKPVKNSAKIEKNSRENPEKIPEKVSVSEEISAETEISEESEIKNNAKILGDTQNEKKLDQSSDKNIVNKQNFNPDMTTQQKTEPSASTDAKPEITETVTPKQKVKENAPESPKTAFAEFLNNIAEQKTARAGETQKPAVVPQFNLQNTGRAAFTEGVENVVRFARSEGMNRATLIIDPPALGKISVEIIATSSGIETALKVSNEQVRALVQDQIVQLRHALQQIGVQATEFSVDVQQQQHDGTNQQFEGQKQKNGAHTADNETDTEIEEEVFRLDLRKGILHWIA